MTPLSLGPVVVMLSRVGLGLYVWRRPWRTWFVGSTWVWRLGRIQGCYLRGVALGPVVVGRVDLRTP